MRLLAAFSALLISSLSPVNAQQQPDQYELAVAIAQNGKHLGTPTMTMQSGQSAVVTATGESGYEIRASLQKPARSADGSLQLDAEIFLGKEGERVLLARPRLTFTQDRPVAISYQREGKPIFLTFTLKRRNMADASRSPA